MIGSDIGLIILLLVAVLIGWVLGYREATRKRFTRTQHYLKHWFLSVESEPISSQHALDELVGLFDFEPESFQTFLSLGDMYRNKGELAKAVQLHQSLMDSTELNALHTGLAHVALGKDYASSGLYDRAEKALLACAHSEVVAVKEQAFLTLIQLYKRQSEWQKTVEIGEQLIAINANYENLHQQFLLEEISHRLQIMTTLNPDKGEQEKTLVSLGKTLKRMPDDNARVQLLKLSIALKKASAKKTTEANGTELNQDEAQNIVNMMDGLLTSHPEYLYQLVDMLAEEQVSEATVLWVAKKIATVLADTKPPQKKTLTLLWYNSWQKLCELSVETYIEKHGLTRLAQCLKSAGIEPQPASENATSTHYINFFCEQCGFETGVFSWDCPSCARWQTLKPKLKN